MRNLLIVLACWACAGHGRRVHSLREKFRSNPPAERQTQLTLNHTVPRRQVSALERPIPKAFARFLLANHPAAAAFAYSGHGIPISHGSRRTFSSSVVPKKLPEVLCSRRNPTPWMVAAKEVFHEYYKKTDWLSKTVMKLPEILPTLAMPGFVIGFGLLGFKAPISKRMLVKIVHGLIWSKFGGKLGEKIGDARERAVLPAIARVLAKDDPHELDDWMIQDIASKCDLTVAEVNMKLGDIYLTYLQACLESDSIDATELSDLLKLKKTLRISSAKVGQQVFKAAQQITGTDKMVKFTFLAERILSEDESLEGYEYDSKRAQKLFQMTKGEWLNIAEEAAVPFYQRAVSSAVVQRKPCTSQQMEGIRRRLGINEERAEQIQVTELCNSVSSALSLAGKFNDDDKEWLRKARVLFGGSATLGNSVRDLTIPLYAETFHEVVGTLDCEPDDEFYKTQSSKLTERLDDLLLVQEDVEETEMNTIRVYAQARLRGMNRQLKEENFEELHKKVQSFILWSQRLSKFMAFKACPEEQIKGALKIIEETLEKEPTEEDLDLGFTDVSKEQFREELKNQLTEEAFEELTEEEFEVAFKEYTGPLTEMQIAEFREELKEEQLKLDLQQLRESLEQELKCTFFENVNRGTLSKDEALEVWRSVARHYLQDGRLDEEKRTNLNFMHVFLDLMPSKTGPVYELLASPIFRREVEQVIESRSLAKVDPDRMERVSRNLGLPSSITDDITIQAYGVKLRGLAGETRQITDRQAVQLEELRGVLNLDMPKVYSVHEALFGVTYCNYLKELIEVARSAEVSEEMWEDLYNEQQRLGISEPSARDLFEMIAQDCFREDASKATVQLTKDQDDQFEDDDVFDSDDIKPFAKLVLRLLNTVQRSRGFTMEEVDGEMVLQSVVNLRKNLKLENCQQLYSEYLKEVYSTTNEELSSILFDNVPKLKMLLGMNDEENQQVQNEIADLIFAQYLGSALDKGRADREDREFLYSIAEDLNVPQDEADGMIRRNEIERCKKVAENVFSKEDFQGEDVTQLIETADTFEIKLVEDMGINPFELETMLDIQLEEVLNGGDRGPKMVEKLAFVVENLQIPEEKAEKMINEWIQENMDAGIMEAWVSWRNDQIEKAAVDLLNTARQSAMAEEFKITQKTPFSVDDRRKLYNLFQMNKPYGISKREHKVRIEILRHVLLSDCKEEDL